MEKDHKYFLKLKYHYLKKSLKIWSMRRRGDNPPLEFIIKARELGQLIGVPEKELEKLWTA